MSATGLRFAAGNHTYRLDGKPVPGVTTLLGKGLPKPAIPYWAAKSVAEFVAGNPDAVETYRSTGRGPMVAALKEIPWQKRDEAAVRGTDVHALAERVLHGKAVEVPEHLADHVDGYVRWLDAFDVHPIATETPCAHRGHWWAGTFDAVLTFGRGPLVGQFVLTDWKTSSGVYGETALQTAAYASAEFMAPTPDDEQPMPNITATAVVHVQAGLSQMYVLSPTREAIDEAYGVFRHIAYVAKRTDWIKTRIGSPVPEPQETA